METNRDKKSKCKISVLCVLIVRKPYFITTRSAWVEMNYTLTNKTYCTGGEDVVCFLWLPTLNRAHKTPLGSHFSRMVRLAVCPCLVVPGDACALLPDSMKNMPETKARMVR